MREGVISFFIRHLFVELLHSKKIAKQPEIMALCRDYDYRHFWKKYKPSAMNFEKRNLNQNSMQSYYLMIHLPFILLKFKRTLGPLWHAMECLLQGLQILYSSSIRKIDVDRLRILLKNHLNYLVENGVNLTPKHHMTTH